MLPCPDGDPLTRDQAPGARTQQNGNIITGERRNAEVRVALLLKSAGSFGLDSTPISCGVGNDW